MTQTHMWITGGVAFYMMVMLGIFFTDILQPFHPDRRDLKIDPAGPAGHKDRGCPTGSIVVGVFAILWHDMRFRLGGAIMWDQVICPPFNSTINCFNRTPISWQSFQFCGWPFL